MIIVNDKNYDKASKKVAFGEYNVNQNGKKRNGYASFITFKFDNTILELEPIYDKKWLEEKWKKIIKFY